MGTKNFQNLPTRKFSDVIPQLSSGDLIFCSGTHPLSWAIRKGSDSDFSHVGIVFKWDATPMLLESVESDGVRAGPLRLYLENYENSEKPYEGDVYLATLSPVLNDAQRNAIFTGAMKLMNRKFDIDDMLKMAVNLALGIGTHDDDNAYVCSEFVEECFIAAGIPFHPNKDGFVFPENIAADSRVQAVCKLVA